MVLRDKSPMVRHVDQCGLEGSGDSPGPGLGFLNDSTVDMGDQITLGCGGCPLLCRMLSSNSGIYPLGASSIPHVVTTENISKCCQIFPKRPNCPQLRTNGLSKHCLVFCGASLSFNIISTFLLKLFRFSSSYLQHRES